MAATCGVGINNAMASAINVLGDVHGGAGEQCVELYRAVMARAEVGEALSAAVEAEIAALQMRGIKHVPGFGHTPSIRAPRGSCRW
jgi:citrate synthase